MFLNVRGKTKAQIASELEVYLGEKVMPYWHDTTIDEKNGGYILSDKMYPARKASNPLRIWFHLLLSTYSQKKHVQEGVKQLVSQCRMLFVFSLVHRAGYSRGNRNYLNAAEVGYRFLIGSMLDRQYGGFFWKTDLEGRVLDPGKSFYGQAFALYALVEYHRASGLSEPLDEALTLYQIVQKEFHDAVNSGWIELGEQDFKPLSSSGGQSLLNPRGMPGIISMKTGNAHMHWMEALIELYKATSDVSVRTSLTEVLHINKTFFYPANAENSCDCRTDDWREAGSNYCDGISYGHNIEFAWLMIRAQKVLRVDLDWNHFDNMLTHALKYGFDHKKGGFYFRGCNVQPAFDKTKVWWVQAEGIAALAEAIYHRADAKYGRALELLLGWISNFQIISDDGIWIASTTEKGRPVDITKAGSWKAAYHEIRAITKFIHMFSPSGNNYVP